MEKTDTEKGEKNGQEGIGTVAGGKDGRGEVGKKKTYSHFHDTKTNTEIKKKKKPSNP